MKWAQKTLRVASTDSLQTYATPVQAKIVTDHIWIKK